MSTGNAAANNLNCVFLPDGDRVIDAAYQSLLAPKHQQRTGDFSISIRLMMFQINRRRRAIILAGGVNARRVAEASQVLRECFGREGIRASPRSYVAQVVFGITAYQCFGQATRLNEEEPMIIGGGDEFIQSLEDLGRWDDIQYSRTNDAIWMIQQKAVRYTSAAIVSRHAKAIEAQSSHHGNLIGGRAAF